MATQLSDKPAYNGQEFHIFTQFHISEPQKPTKKVGQLIYFIFNLWNSLEKFSDAWSGHTDRI